MKRTKWFLICLLSPLLGAYAIEPPSGLNLEGLGGIPIQEGGRYKPLESYAGKAMETLTGRWRFKGNDPMACLVSMLAFSEWADEAMILLDYHPLKEALGLPVQQKYFSFHRLVALPALSTLQAHLMEKIQSGEEQTTLERRTGELLHRLNLFNSLSTGEELTLAPPPPGSDENAAWMTIPAMTGYPSDATAGLRASYNAMIQAVRQSDAAAFAQACLDIKTRLAALNPAAYPPEQNIRREIQYNHMRPFLYSWIFFLIAFFAFLASYSFPRRAVVGVAVACFALGYVLNTYGFVMRGLIAGHPPIANMYESVIFVGWGVVTFSWMFELVYRTRWVLTVSSLLAVGLFVIADLMPFDSNIEPLMPVLRSNYWLIIHVMTITLSYSLFALATAVAHVILGLAWVGSRRMDRMATLCGLLYRLLQVGVVMLAAGTILGGVWAAESWGRFWGWDPKETWALISLLGYLAILHARYTGWLYENGTAVSSILGFWLILMTWYGVNYVLGKGLHSYGFGSGGGWYVLGFLLIETVILIAFGIRYRYSPSPYTVSEISLDN